MKFPGTKDDWCFCGGRIVASIWGKTCLNQQTSCTPLGYLGFVFPPLRSLAGLGHGKQSSTRKI